MATPTPAPAELALRRAMEAKDVAGVVDAFAPDGVVHSPFTDRVAFEGREQIGAITRIVLDVFEDLHYISEVRGPQAALLVARARIGTEAIEIADHLRLDADGKVVEMTVFFRPLPAATLALRAIGTRLGRRHSPRRGGLISVLTLPMTLLSRGGDGIGARLLGPTL